MPSFTPLVDVASWPRDLVCDTAHLRELYTFFPHMTDSRSQWLARFVSVDASGGETTHPALHRLVQTMSTRGYAFEIICGPSTTASGSLYLWCTAHAALVAVFRPSPPASPVAPPMSVRYYAPHSQVYTPHFQHDSIAIWNGLLQVRLPERVLDVLVTAFQSQPSVNIKELDSAIWPPSLWCTASNMSVGPHHPDDHQHAVRLVATGMQDPSAYHVLREFALFMRARRIIFEISCTTKSADPLLLSLIAVPDPTYGDCLIGAFRVRHSVWKSVAAPSEGARPKPTPKHEPQPSPPY